MGKQLTVTSKVCSNHFIDGRPTDINPYPYVTNEEQNMPKKRKNRDCSRSVISKTTTTQPIYTGVAVDGSGDGNTMSLTSCVAFDEMTRDVDVKFFTGFDNRATLKTIFNFLSEKAACMVYWKGGQTRETLSNNKMGRRKKLILEDEYFMVLMRLRLGLLVRDLSHRFNVSISAVSSIFSTWIRLMRLELSCIIIWPSKNQTKALLPAAFVQFYPHTRCIVDCTEISIETPTALDLQAATWSDYKHSNTIQFLIAITPNGLISYVSPCYGGRASDKYIFTDCGILDFIEPHDEIMADRGFKVQEILMSRHATLAIPPSVYHNAQMTNDSVKTTSRIANVRIYVEQAIGRMKNFRILKNTLEVKTVPLMDDVVIVCAAISNLKRALCS
ncbi:uncharacterized protein LOC141910027 [Tubulanus polymorphus]|uniref:uncharacterized protein LOC141910027 n=1 Tax=Tubulanus polymorphus TaxID=672921 RepID=UPI003DA44106